MLNLRHLWAIAFSVASLAFATEPSLPPELRGILTTGSDTSFILTTSGGGHTGWVSVGQTFENWKVIAHHAADDAIVISRGDERVTLKLKSASVGTTAAEPAARATLAQADEMLTKMKFEAMWDKIFTEQKKGITSAIRQQAEADFAKHGLTKVEIETLIDQMGAAACAGLDPEIMRQDFARIYSETYTKDELRGMADFYDTSAGQAWAAKQPEVQQKLMQAMMPRVMQGMPAAQKVAFDYLRQRASNPSSK